MRRRQPKQTAAQRELADSWEALLRRHSAPLEKGAVARGISPCKKQQSVAVKEIVTAEKRSGAAGMMGVAAAVPPKVYTGSAIIGIATLHKSNLVPIFNEEAARDAASMRR